MSGVSDPAPGLLVMTSSVISNEVSHRLCCSGACFSAFLTRQQTIGWMMINRYFSLSIYPARDQHQNGGSSSAVLYTLSSASGSATIGSRMEWYAASAFPIHSDPSLGARNVTGP